MTLNSAENFEDVKARLDEIVEAVSSDDISLDDALKLYEEAVELGLVASSLLEENLEAKNAAYDEDQASDHSLEEATSDATIQDQADLPSESVNTVLADESE
jgi:exodeoxyribonuclease VII small subunit